MMKFLQKLGKALMLPVACLPICGILMGLGYALCPSTMQGGDVVGIVQQIGFYLVKAGGALIDNMAILFAIGIGVGMSEDNDGTGGLAALASWLMLTTLLSVGAVSVIKTLEEGTTAYIAFSKIANPFIGIIAGVIGSSCYNKFKGTKLPDWLSFFSGKRCVAIVAGVVSIIVSVVLLFVWPVLFGVLVALGEGIAKMGAVGAGIYAFFNRLLIPFGLHHVFYMPFWQTAVGGTMMVDGNLIQGGQNIFFAQLASSDVTHFSADATRYFSGEFIFMIFGLPGAALAMYRCAKPEKKKAAGGLLLSAALACMFTGITEPIEFSFLFVAPMLFAVQVILAGSAYMVAHILNIAVGLTFSGGLLDLVIFGVLQGNAKTSWLRIIPAGVVYFLLYYVLFSFLIKKFDLKTPGREDDDEETKLYTKADVNARRTEAKEGESCSQAENSKDSRSAAIAMGMGGRNNITSVDCCATRLRCSIADSSLVDEKLLKSTGAVGVIVKGQGIQIIYGPQVTVIKSELEAYLAEEHEEDTAEATDSAENMGTKVTAETEASVNLAESKNIAENIHKLYSPFQGVLKPITEAPDEAFASKAMGDGYLVMPEDGIVEAPEDGEVMFVFPSKHAIGLKAADGTEYLLHIGVDTVKLNGEGFTVFVSDGQKIKKGEKLMEFDPAYIREHAVSDACIVIFTGLTEGESLSLEGEKQVKRLELIGQIRK